MFMWPINIIFIIYICPKICNVYFITFKIFNTFTKDRFPQISNANREWLNKNLGDMDLNTINIDNITNGFVNAVRKRADDYNKHITSRAKNYNSKIIKN